MSIPRAVNMLLSGALVVSGSCSSATLARPPAAPVDWSSFASLRSPANVTPPPMQDVAHRYLSALDSPRPRMLASLFTANAHGSFCGSMTVTGREAVLQLHEMLFAPFEARTVVATRIFDTAAVAIVEWTLTGRQDHDWMAVGATHAPVTFDGITLLWKMNDGTISDIHVYFDVAMVKAQLGAEPKGVPVASMSSPSTQPLTWHQGDTAVEMDDVLTVRGALDALAAEDEPGYLSLMTRGVVIRTLERAEPTRGETQARRYYEAVHRAIGQLETRVDNIWGVQSYVVVEYELSGLQLGPIDLVPLRKDRVVQLHVVDVVELRDDRIAQIWRYDDPSEIVSDVP